jgi:ketosteroid isomerase-like protein
MNTESIIEFIEAINHGNTEMMIRLMTDDHLFIDSQGNPLQGKEKMVEAWKGYFALFADYRIEIEESIEKGSLVCLFGYASATYIDGKTKEHHFWRIPAAWKAIVENKQISHWQVYADNSVVIALMK